MSGVVRGSDLMRSLLDRARVDGGIAIDDMLGSEGPAGLGLALMALSAAAMVPLPGPFGLLFGSCLMLVALQMLVGRRQMRLPGVIGRRRLPLKVVETILTTSLPAVTAIERRLSHGRLGFLTGHIGHVALAILVFGLGLLIALPIPFGNTLPALSVMLIAVALANRDGLVVLAAVLLSAVAGTASVFLIQFAGHLLAGLTGT